MAEPPPLALDMRRLLRPGDFGVACPALSRSSLVSVPSCYYGNLDLEADTEEAGGDPQAAFAPASLGALIGREVRPGQFVCEIIGVPPGAPAPRVVFLWRAAWRGTPLEDAELLATPLRRLPLALGFAPARLVALLCDRIRLERSLVSAAAVSRALRAARAYDSPLRAVPRLGAYLVLAGAAVLGLFVLAAIRAGRQRRHVRRFASRVAGRFGAKTLALAVLGLGLLVGTGAALVAYGAALGGSAFAEALDASSDPENFFAPRLPAGQLDAARQLRIPDGDGDYGSGSSRPLFDGSERGTLRGARVGSAAQREGDVAIRFASPAARRRFFLAELPAAPLDGSVAVAASPTAVLLARLTPAGPQPASLLLTLLRVVPAPCATTRPDVADFAVEACLSPADAAPLLHPRGPEPRPTLRLACVPLLDPAAPNATDLHFAAGGDGESGRLWEEGRRRARRLEQLRRRQSGREETQQALAELCDTASRLAAAANLAPFGLPALAPADYWSDPGAAAPLPSPCAYSPPPPTTGDRDAPFIQHPSVGRLRFAALACPPGTGRYLSSSGTLEREEQPGGAAMRRARDNADAYQLKAGEVVFERRGGNVFRMRLVGTDGGGGGGGYLAPPVGCGAGEPPVRLDPAQEPAARASWVVDEAGQARGAAAR